MKLGADRLPPTVPRWISISRALNFVSNPIPILSQNLETYGPTYQFHIGGIKRGIVTCDARVIQHVLQKNHRNYHKSDIQRKILAQFVGYGLLTADGDFWLRQRRLIQPGFHRDRINNLTSLMQQEIRQFYDDLADKARSNPHQNIHREMHRLAFRIVAKTLFSTSIEETQLEQLASQITQLQAFIIKLVRQPYAKWWYRFSGEIKRHLEIAEQTRAVIRKIIRKRMLSGEVEDDLLQMLVESRYQDNGKPMSEGQVLDECLIIFVAGHETSANALSWAIQLLSTHPDSHQALLNEVSTIANLDQIGSDEIHRLPCTKQVIEESMRLYPPGWVLDRVAIEDDAVAGWKIAAGSTLFLYVYGAHHSAKYWSRPERFTPERFSENNRENQTAFSYLPFGGGPRLCIGNHFAMLEMQLVLSQFVKRFAFSPHAKVVPVEPLITLRPKQGIFGDLAVRH